MQLTNNIRPSRPSNATDPAAQRRIVARWVSCVALLALWGLPTTLNGQEQQIITPSDIGSFETFGAPISLSGDRVAVGRPEDSTLGQNVGSTMLYTLVGDTWQLEAKLNPPGIGIGAFGASVALDGDGDTIAIGAPFDNGKGSVYIFEKIGSTWTHTAKVVSASSSANDQFGWETQLSGNRLVVSAPYASKGLIYVFERVQGIFQEQAVLSDTGASRLGDSLALSGDRIAAGAPGSRTSHIFAFDGVTWSQEASFGTSALLSRYGEAIAMEGNWMAVGASGANDIGGDGKVYMYRFDGASWSNAGSLGIPQNQAIGNSFGTAIDINQDMLAIGADTTFVAGQYAGSTHLYRLEANVWNHFTQIVVPQALHWSFYGLDVEIGDNDLLAGAPGFGPDGALITHSLDCMASTKTYGQSCTNATIGANSSPIIGNSLFAFNLVGAPTDGLSALVFSTSDAEIPLTGTCSVYVDPAAFAFTVTPFKPVSIFGSASVPFGLPGIPSLCGVDLFAQFALIDNSGALSTTDAIHCRLGSWIP